MKRRNDLIARFQPEINEAFEMRDAHKRKVEEFKHDIDQYSLLITQTREKLKIEEDAVTANDQRGRALEHSLKRQLENKQTMVQNRNNVIRAGVAGGGGERRTGTTSRDPVSLLDCCVYCNAHFSSKSLLFKHLNYSHGESFLTHFNL